MIAEYGTREIFNADQDTRFTSDDFAGVLKCRGITSCVDGDLAAPNTQMAAENRRTSVRRFTSLIDIADHEDHDPTLAR